MALFKCKMCGGSLEIAAGTTVIECEYCGTKQTLPKLDDDRRANLYDRANHFRRNNEFDKAMGIYEQILNEDNTDSEAYWSIVLCRYGIEYVEDPSTKRRVPTVNRAQFTSIFDDDNYKSALQYADSYQRSVYENEAREINEIQKGILAISQKEEPFDVFICYKETDNNGRRTPDSVLAQELYFGLKNEGFKVFFSRITLEDKLGSAYEPYIFAALNSAKVMVVLGTKPEFFNAVWVKNEWSRYLALIKQGQKKMLIPAYKDMDPYDLPEEFSHLQAQDMSKLGFMQDLVRGIKKIVKASEPKPTVVKETVVESAPISGNVAPLLKRAFMFLEDGDFERADGCCEQVLNQDPENATAYLGKLMAELEVQKQENLADCDKPFDSNSNYTKAMRFGDESLKKTLQGYIEHINERIENDRLESAYQSACAMMRSAATSHAYHNAANAFKAIIEYKDSSNLVTECLEKAEVRKGMELMAEKDAIYNSAVEKMHHNPHFANSWKNYEIAIQIFKTIPGWRDADAKILECQSMIEKLKAEAEAESVRRKQEAEKTAKRNRLMAIVTIAIICAIWVVAIVVSVVNAITNNNKYNDAVALMGAGKYDEAIVAFEELYGHKDSADKITECKYSKAIVLMNRGEYKEAFEMFNELGDYKIAQNHTSRCKDLYVEQSIKNGQYSALKVAIIQYEWTNVDIPYGITEIPKAAFKECTTLTSVTIPDSVTSIGAEAFRGCAGLTSINIPDSVESIGDYAFYNCKGLKSVQLGSGVKNIDTYAFYGCINITKITIPKSVTKIESYAFDGTKISKATFENSKGWHPQYDYLANIISSTSLANSSTAAKYLTDTYCSYDWLRY